MEILNSDFLARPCCKGEIFHHSLNSNDLKTENINSTPDYFCKFIEN